MEYAQYRCEIAPVESRDKNQSVDACMHVELDRSSSVSTLSVILSSKTAAKFIVILFAITSIMSVVIGILAQLGILYLIIAFAASSWLIYRSTELLRAPTTKNAVKMRIHAPRYLTIVCIAIAISIVANAILL